MIHPLKARPDDVGALADSSAGAILSESWIETFAADPAAAAAAAIPPSATVASGGSLPSLSVAPVAIVQDGAPTDNLTFTVTLSAPSARVVTANYTVWDGNAHAGVDYDNVGGTVVFTAGQTAATVAVPVHPGPPGAHYLFFGLNSPVNATWTPQGVVGIFTDIARPVSAASVVVHQAAYQPTIDLIAPGWLHTSGNQIVDANGNTVKLNAANWAGLESTHFAPDGLWAQSYKTILDAIVQSGFNTVRLPFSDQLFDAGSRPADVDYRLNPELAGQTGLGIIDKIVAYAGQIGLRVVLDHHADTAGNAANPLWWDATYSEARVLADWKLLASRYAGNPAVIGADLHNEPHGAASWGDGGATDFAKAVTIAGDALQAINPHLLIVVDGIEAYANHWNGWGGNLLGVKDHPITLTVPNQVVYSPHDYPNSVENLEQNQGPAADQLAVFNYFWGYIYQQNIAPVWLGEYGSSFKTATDQNWITELENYAAGNLAAQGGITVKPGNQGISGAYWSFNGNNTQTAGILSQDWTTTDTSVLEAIQQPTLGVPAGTNAVAPSGLTAPGQDVVFQVALAQPSAAPVTVHYATRDGTAHAGEDYTPISGDLTFAAGDTLKLVTAHLLEPGTHTGQSLQFLLDTTVTSGAAQTGPAAVATIVYDRPVTPANQAPLPGAVSVHVDRVNGSTVNGTVTITNSDSIPYTDWEVRLTTADTITGVTGGQIANVFGINTLIAWTDANATIPAHGSLSFQFQATDPAGNSPITAALLKFGT